MTNKSTKITVFAAILVVAAILLLSFRTTKTSSVKSASVVPTDSLPSASWPDKPTLKPSAPKTAVTSALPEASLPLSDSTKITLNNTSNTLFERITQVIQFAPIMNSETGKIELKIRPGRDFGRFKELGFEAGDRITRVNDRGLVLEDSSLATLLNEITSHPNQETVVEIERNGYSMTIILFLSDL